MKIKIHFKLSLPLLLLLLTTGCTGIKKSDAEYEREEWIAGFSDSIGFYQGKIKEIEGKLENLNGQINERLKDFDYIKKPKEVSGYYLLKGWNQKIPLTATGVYARINENEKLEMIATMAGGTFNRLKAGEFYTETVPHDQAFNFRHQRFNTVYFQGGKADTVAEYIAHHHDQKVTLDYLEGSKKKAFVLPDPEKDMIRQTWNLYSAQQETKKLQKELWICSKKIETFRRILNDNIQTDNKQ